MNILVTGSAGYIGSTIANALQDCGHVPIGLDSLTSGVKVFANQHIFYEGDISDLKVLESIVMQNRVDAVIHCAALVIVPESVANPTLYYNENVVKSLQFFENLSKVGLNRVIFSSSASVYDSSTQFVVTENSPVKPSSPYARSKLMMEMILEDICLTSSFSALALRYFNPIGADPKLRSGVHVRNPTHVLGKLVQVATQKQMVFEITGTNWPTPDGSGMRDYIHVWDLAMAHVCAVERFQSILERSKSRYGVINLGTGRGVSVKQLVKSFERVWGKEIPKIETAARAGDVVGAYANVDRAFDWLGWRAEMTLDDGISSALKWDEKRLTVLGYE